MDAMNENPQPQYFPSFLRVVRRRAWVVVVCVVVAAVAGYGFSKSQTEQYTATASMLFQQQQLVQQSAGLPGVSGSDPQGEADTNLNLATLPRIAAATAAAIGNGATQASVANAVSVSQLSDTDLLQVAATAQSPALAARIANEYVHQAILYREQSSAAYYASALHAVKAQLKGLTPVQQQSVQGVDLKDRVATLQTLAQLQHNAVQVAQPASVPTSPSSPQTTRNVILACIFGLLLGLVIAFGLERFDRRMREPSDLEAAYGLPLLGVVPESSALKVKDAAASELLPEREAETFGLIRAHVRYFNVDRNPKVIVVASAAPGDGKSTVARNLAIAAARVGEHVLFLEADFRRPVAAKSFHVSHSPGISEILIKGLSLDEAVQQSVVADGAGRQVAVDVLVAGGVLPSNPGQVTESRAMEALLHQSRNAYDFVVVDTPPLTVLSDAFPLLRTADGVVIVGRVGQNRRDVAERLRATLEAAGVPLIGVVANGYHQRDASPYGYGYGYGYGNREGERASRPVEVLPTNGAGPDDHVPSPRRRIAR